MITNIKEKIYNNERLTRENGLELYKSNDLLTLGQLASYKNPSKNVYWINNHHFNVTNICEGTCKFCAYRRKEGQDGAFIYHIDKAVEYLNKINKNVKEIHIVSALNPDCNLDFYKKLLEASRRILPNTHIQAFTAVEIDYLAKLENISAEEVLKELISSGLGSLPGGGAEIFAENIRQKVCPEKISGKRWLKIMEIAHKLGLKSNVTMLTGIGETPKDKIDHMLAVRDLQNKTKGFMSFIPLFCHYENTEVSSKNKPTGVEILKEFAIARLMLDNVPHIKAFRIQTGTKLAQISLSFGVDDLDGTVMEEKITRFAGSKDPDALMKEEIEHLITRAGKIPFERDTVYNVVS
ncbi:MAG: aminofutalosine synthase MqnE [Candidatus Melainabacteria bacterium GWF2_37_15]|nr:MAG: aminofutalosine synthase MqnE [Candidatus Melainabacteria bacterium GWF2_37_15]